MNKWISTIDETIGYQGQTRPNLEFLSPGQYLLNEREVIFGLNSAAVLAYPNECLSPQTCRLIGMIIEQKSRLMQFEELDPIAFFLREVLEGQMNPALEQEASKLGLVPFGRYLPILVQRAENQGKIDEIMGSYFSCRIYRTMISPWGYYLIPLRELALEDESLDEFVELVNGLAELVIVETGKNSLAIGLPVASLKEWKEAFEKGKKSLLAGRTFFPERKVYCTWQMNLETMILDCPDETKKQFVQEILGKWNESHLYAEYSAIVSTLLEENMNLSEAARRLFIHRNTLNYRIDRFKLETGKDLRIARDVWLVYLAFMLRKSI
jgi:carbohydrate diacid regulator